MIDDIDNFKTAMYEKSEKNDPLTKQDLDRLLADAAARPALVDEQQKLRGGESILVLNVYISKIYSF
jgi:hypothetical protein